MLTPEERKYQIIAANNFVDDIFAGYRPVTALPTGTGKSYVICMICDLYLSRLPHKNILILADDSNIVRQNAVELENYVGHEMVGIYCADLHEKLIRKITVGTIQSIYRNPELFNNFGLIIIDECHMVNSKDAGIYRKFIAAINASVGGLTATPYRTGQGYLYKSYPGVKNLFNKLSSDYTSYEKYNELIENGYIVNAIPAPTNYTMDPTGITIVNGEYDPTEKSNKFNRKEITEVICDNIIKYAGAKYKKWLIFTMDIEHCEAVNDYLISKGVASKAVHSKMAENKLDIIRDYKAGKYKALTNVFMLTTGVNIQEVDLVAIINTSLSANYLVQVAGRGGRAAPWIGKTHFLLLDYGGNIDRHGPINDIRILEPGEKIKNGVTRIMAKACGNCKTKNPLRAKECIACGEEFEIKNKLSPTASTSAPVAGINKTAIEKKQELIKWILVEDISYSIHEKKGSPSSLRVMYKCGLQTFSEWVAIDHPNNFAKSKAQKWVDARWAGEDENIPTNLHSLYKNLKFLKVPYKIRVDMNGQFTAVIDYEFLKESAMEYKPKSNLANNLVMDVMSDLFDDDVPF